MAEYELIRRGDKVSILDPNTDETTTLPQATQIMALSLYEKFVDYKKEDNEENKEKLKEDMIAQSMILNSMANACRSTEQVRR